MSLSSTINPLPVAKATAITNAALGTTVNNEAYTSIFGFINGSITAQGNATLNQTLADTSAIASFLIREFPSPTMTLVNPATGDLTPSTTAQVIAAYTLAGYTVTATASNSATTTKTLISIVWPA